MIPGAGPVHLRDDVARMPLRAGPWSRTGQNRCRKAAPGVVQPSLTVKPLTGVPVVDLLVAAGLPLRAERLVVVVGESAPLALPLETAPLAACSTCSVVQVLVSRHKPNAPILAQHALLYWSSPA